MKGRVVALARPAEPSSAQVLDEYLAEQRVRLKPKAFGQYESVIQLLRHCLDGYACESLSKPERALFERAYDGEGAAHRELCALFGPEKIPESLDGFLGSFIIREVAGGPELLRVGRILFDRDGDASSALGASAGGVAEGSHRWLQ